MTKVNVECSSCGGTGLYSGMCEREGTAVVCLTCDGSGCEVISYKPFEGRKRKRGIRSISQSRGTFIATGVGATGTPMTYAEFEARYRPGRKDGR